MQNFTRGKGGHARQTPGSLTCKNLTFHRNKQKFYPTSLSEFGLIASYSTWLLFMLYQQLYYTPHVISHVRHSMQTLLIIQLLYYMHKDCLWIVSLANVTVLFVCYHVYFTAQAVSWTHEYNFNVFIYNLPCDSPPVSFLDKTLTILQKLGV